MHQKERRLRIIGFVTSLALTLAAYLVIIHPDLFYLRATTAVIVISILAVLQFSTQFLCFVRLRDETGAQWNLGVFISTLSIIAIVLIGSIWIMHHLDYNMMPQELMHTHGCCDKDQKAKNISRECKG